MKKCPFSENETARPEPVPPPAAEDEFPWYFRRSFILFMLANLLVLALPLVWFRPRTGLKLKVAITVAVALFTWAVILTLIKLWHVLCALFGQIFADLISLYGF